MTGMNVRVNYHCNKCKKKVSWYAQKPMGESDHQYEGTFAFIVAAILAGITMPVSTFVRCIHFTCDFSAMRPTFYDSQSSRIW